MAWNILSNCLQSLSGRYVGFGGLLVGFSEMNDPAGCMWRGVIVGLFVFIGGIGLEIRLFGR